MPISKTTEAFEVKFCEIRHEPTKKRNGTRLNLPRSCRNHYGLFAMMLLLLASQTGQAFAEKIYEHEISPNRSASATEAVSTLTDVFEFMRWEKETIESSQVWETATETVLQHKMLAVSYSDRIKGNVDWSNIKWGEQVGWQQPAVVYGTETVL